MFPELTRECPVVTAALVHIMLDRARQFTSGDLRDEKLVSLGKLAAGLAHELNNPASAVVRSSKLLIESLSAAEEASRILASAGLTPEQFAAIDRARAMCDAARGNAPSTPLERADREDELTDWLADHRATQEYAIPLADTGITPGALDLLAKTVSGDALEAALGWISSCVLVKSLASEIETCGGAHPRPRRRREGVLVHGPRARRGAAGHPPRRRRHADDAEQQVAREGDHGRGRDRRTTCRACTRWARS